MGLVFAYSLYSSILLTGMYLCYKWILSGENQHCFNRMVLGKNAWFRINI